MCHRGVGVTASTTLQGLANPFRLRTGGSGDPKATGRGATNAAWDSSAVRADDRSLPTKPAAGVTTWVSSRDRRPTERRPLLAAAPEDLKRIGLAAFGGESTHPPGLSGIPVGDLDRYAMAFLEAAGYPSSGTPQWDAAHTRFLDELTHAAELAGDWGFVGALCVGWNCVDAVHRADPRYSAIVDRALDVLRRDGVSYTSVPPFAMDRWQSIHGFDGSRPKGWPSALAYLPIPDADAVPEYEDLRVGASHGRWLKRQRLPSNMIHAERRPDGSIQAVLEGADPETGQSRRWDWEGLSAPDYPSFLRELGDRLVTHSYWAHDDLIPYFPCRQRSRDQMRIEARAVAL